MLRLQKPSGREGTSAHFRRWVWVSGLVVFGALRLPHWFRGAVEAQSRAGSRSCFLPADRWGQRGGGGQVLSQLLCPGQCGVAVLELGNIPGLLFHITFSFPSRAQPVPTATPCQPLQSGCQAGVSCCPGPGKRHCPVPNPSG